MWIILVICLAAMSTVFPVCAGPAAAPANVRTMPGENTGLFESFLMGGQMYVFFRTEKQAAGEIQVSLTEDEVIKEEKTAIPFTDSGQYVHYYILLDNSGSVKASSPEIKEFILTLMRETKANRIVTVATLGTVSFAASNTVENAAADRKLILKEDLNTILELPAPTVVGEDRYKEYETPEPSDGENETESEPEAEPGNDIGIEPDSEDKNGTDRKPLSGSLPVYGIFLLGGFLLGAAAVLFVKLKTRKRYNANTGFLHMEVIAGNCRTKKKEFSLEHTLLIDSGRECDIIRKEKSISEQSARIFIHDGIPCIEDLNSPQGTLLNGMRIFAPNRLRSGDIVSIGKVRFRVFF